MVTYIKIKMKRLKSQNNNRCERISRCTHATEQEQNRAS